MLVYNFDRLFKARFISKPHSYLISHGFSSSFASRVTHNKVKILRRSEMEKLCVLLKCTPNDLMEWTPDKRSTLDNDHPLYELKKPDSYPDLCKTFYSIPRHLVDEVNNLILERIEQE